MFSITAFDPPPFAAAAGDCARARFQVAAPGTSKGALASNFNTVRLSCMLILFPPMPRSGTSLWSPLWVLPELRSPALLRALRGGARCTGRTTLDQRRTYLVLLTDPVWVLVET